MQTVIVSEGDTWESIAEAQGVPLASLLSANGLSPDASNDEPDPGSTVAIPPAPASLAVAPGEDHNVDLPCLSGFLPSCFPSRE